MLLEVAAMTLAATAFTLPIIAINFHRASLAPPFANLFALPASAPNHGRLTVTFLDVGQGEAILIESPEGHRILLDGGPSGEAITPALGRHLPFYDRRLDLVMLTHPQLDHIGGLPTVIDQYAVGRVLSSPAQVDSAAYRAWSD